VPEPTEAGIRERLLLKRDRLATWEEIEFLLERLEEVRKEHTTEMNDVGREMRQMQSEIDALERERERTNWL
jgi:hypothetical protein